MATTTVKYLPKSGDEKQSTTHHFHNDIQIFYLKTTIVVLVLALATVTAILVWQLIANKDDCEREKINQAEDLKKVHSSTSDIKISKSGTERRCPSTIRKDLLPYGLPTAVQKILKNVRYKLKQEIDKKSLVSLSASAFYRDQTVWKAGFGVIDKSSFPLKTPDEHTLYRTGSVAKLLTTLMTFKLLQDKKIDCLDVPFHKYAPKFSIENPFNDDAISIRQMLSHTSGLPREVPCGPSFSLQRQTICPVNTTYVYEQLKNVELKFAPGTFVAYSNLGYALLAHSLFEQFGNGYGSWEQWISVELLVPLGMTNTVLDDSRYFGNVAVNYKDNGIITPKLDWGWSSPSFQMSTSAADLTKLMMSLVSSENAILRENIVREMFKPAFGFPDLQTMFSPGWQINNQNSLRVITKAGAVPGSSAALFLVPEVQFGFILLNTGQEIAPKLTKEISNEVTNAFVSSALPSTPEIKLPAKPLQYIGKYILENRWSDQVHATITFESFSRRLKLEQEPGYPSFVYLRVKSTQLLQIVYPRGLSCLTYALGQDKELLKFEHFDSVGRWKQFKLGSFLFKRVG